MALSTSFRVVVVVVVVVIVVGGLVVLLLVVDVGEISVGTITALSRGASVEEG